MGSFPQPLGRSSDRARLRGTGSGESACTADNGAGWASCRPTAVDGIALASHRPPHSVVGALLVAFAQMLAVFAELERRMIGQRISAALKVKMDAGRQPHRCSPKIPKRVRRRIVQMHQAGISQRRIAETLNAERVQAQGSRWHRGTVIRVLARETA
jgi:hypothetical protein